MKKLFLIVIVFAFLAACKKNTSPGLKTCWVHGHVINKISGLGVPNFTVQISRVLPSGYGQQLASPATDINGYYSVVLNLNSNLTTSDKINIFYAGPGAYNFTNGNGTTAQVQADVQYNVEYYCLTQYHLFFKSTAQIADSINYHITNQYQPTAATTIIPNQNNIAIGFLAIAAGTKSYLYYTTYKAGVLTNYVDSLSPLCQTNILTDTVKYN